MIVGVMDVMENFFWIGIVGALIALLFAYSQAKKVKQYSEGTPTMQKIAAAIRIAFTAQRILLKISIRFQTDTASKITSRAIVFVRKV